MQGEGKFYLTDEAGRRIFGPGPAELLEQVERTGSLRAAAGKMGLSYSKALKILHTAERGLAMPLVSTEAGGLGGGGSTITPQARALLAWFRQARRAVEETARAQLDRLPRGGQMGNKKTAPRWSLISNGALFAGGRVTDPAAGRYGPYPYRCCGRE